MILTVGTSAIQGGVMFAIEQVFRKPIPESLQGKVVMITGGSAGVGRAAARAFAREGANVALLARDVAGLEDAKAEIESFGGEARIFPADVADAEAVFAAAAQCEVELGPIDIWVNNAMATVFSPVEQLTPEEIRRVTEVTYLGYVHGTLAALRHMRPRDRGVIVQVGSSLAYRGIPLQAAYCGAKHAVRGFTDSLRTELLHHRSNVAVTAVHLPAVNTPQFEWARTRMRKAFRPVAPVYTSRAAALAIVHAATHPKREYWLGGTTSLTIIGDMLFPGLLDRFLAREAVDGQQKETEIGANRSDNLFLPVSGRHRTNGAFSAEARPDPAMLSAQTIRFATIAGACVLIGFAGAVLGARRASAARTEKRCRPR
ncbi:short-chain dehydrogenase/reductase SDR [Nitrobacter winogradskyi Nb-255]|uniref:Short-chain dehydrogenase/reductase SDR n=2 Tax=Nitrobacter winogradskyi TaxID=913 RepID=Q3SQ77_NITWN|nr:short-chain dehydrogenase/reductase SDR [Nitrobacter winogradskyi Nb-255]